jgi:hypothetical protein
MGQTTFSGPVVSQNGFIENSFTTAQRDAIVDPTAGLLIYNTTTNAYEVYNGTSWQDAFGPSISNFDWTSSVDYQEASLGVTYNTLRLDMTGFSGNVEDLLRIPSGTILSVVTGSGTYAATMGGTFTYNSFVGVYDAYVTGTGLPSTLTPVTEIIWSQPNVPVALPTVTGVNPSTVDVAGGVEVSVSGTEFAGATLVEIGGVDVGAFTIISDTYLAISSVPAHIEALGLSVKVTNSVGASANNSIFDYIGVPTVTAISPDNGSAAGGDTVVITGSGYMATDGISFVYGVTIGGTAVDSYTVDSPTQITVVTGAHVAEAGVDVAVTTEFGTSVPNTLFTYA